MAGIKRPTGPKPKMEKVSTAKLDAALKKALQAFDMTPEEALEIVGPDIDKFTAIEIAFCLEYLKDHSPAGAWRRCHGLDQGEITAKNRFNGYRWRHHRPHIKAYLDGIDQRGLEVMGLHKAWIAARFRALAEQNEDQTVALRATAEIAKLAGYYEHTAQMPDGSEVPSLQAFLQWVATQPGSKGTPDAR